MHRNSAATIWLTGMPGAGKTTLARRLESHLRAQCLRVEVLDGDQMRRIFADELSFTMEDRHTIVRRVGFVCSLLNRNGVFAIAAVVSPYREARNEVRLMHAPGGFVEVFVHCPLPELVLRDRNGIYPRALRGEIPDFTGVSDPYEPPEYPEITVETHLETADQSLERVLNWLRQMGYLSPVTDGRLASMTDHV